MVAVALAIAVICFSGCVNPKNMPGIRGIVDRETDQITKATEEAVKSSPLLQELDHLCKQEISVPNDFVLVSRNTGTTSAPTKRTFLGYGYQSASEYALVKSFYKERLVPKGWAISSETDGGSLPHVEFQKDSYIVKIYRMSGRDDANYSLLCAKLLARDIGGLNPY